MHNTLNKHLNRKYPCLDVQVKQHEYLYVIQTREHIKLNLPVYKVGRSKQSLYIDGNTKRMQQYPKGSVQLALFTGEDCISAENNLINKLIQSHDLKHRLDIGHEYFEGQLSTILAITSQTVSAFIPQSLILQIL